jgi:ABC-type phosphate transport system ATPase subunit
MEMPLPTTKDGEEGVCLIEYVKTKGRNSKTIVQSMKLDFPDDSVTAILGPSGSGKVSLLLRTLVRVHLQTTVYSKIRHQALRRCIQMFLPSIFIACPKCV